jgi:TPR repeat protein
LGFAGYLPPTEQFHADQLQAKQGDVQAIYALVSAYADGSAGVNDYGKAVKYLKIAASNGSHRAYRTLAKFYGRGFPGERWMLVEYDPEKADQYISMYVDRLREMAQQETSDYKALKSLGFTYERGRWGIEENLLQARATYDRMLKVLEKAASSGDVAAQLELYDIHDGGSALMIENQQLAQQWLSKAVATEDPRALYKLASTLRAGSERELELLKKAYHSGYPRAASRLSRRYSQLDDSEKALKFSIKAWELLPSGSNEIDVADAYNEAGQINEAIDWRLKAIGKQTPYLDRQNLFKLYVMIKDEYTEGVAEKHGYSSEAYENVRNLWLSSPDYSRFYKSLKTFVAKCDFVEGDYKSDVCGFFDDIPNPQS